MNPGVSSMCRAFPRGEVGVPEGRGRAPVCRDPAWEGVGGLSKTGLQSCVSRGF